MMLRANRGSPTCAAPPLRSRFFVAFLGFINILAVPGFAQQLPEGRTVISIRQQPENSASQVLDSAEFSELVLQKVGQPYHADLIRDSISRLYQTGRFADIRVDATEQESGVAVTFLTYARYFIGAVQVSGVPAPPTEGALRSATALQLGQPFSEQDLDAVVTQLKRLLEDEGYFQTSISHRTEPHPSTQQVDVYF